MNILHHVDLADAWMDIDGVLCPDPEEEQNDDGPRDAEFLRQTPTRLVPGTQVSWLVTARLERYREQRPATFKAEVYRRTKAWLFIESSVEQAVAIADTVRRPVYCTDERVMVHPGVPVGDPAPKRHAAGWQIRDIARHQRRRLKSVPRKLVDGVGRVVGRNT